MRTSSLVRRFGVDLSENLIGALATDNSTYAKRNDQQQRDHRAGCLLNDMIAADRPTGQADVVTS